MTTRNLLRVAAAFTFACSLAACHGGGQLIPSSNASAPFSPALQNTTANGTPIQAMSLSEPAPTSFLPSSWGKIGSFQIFDETNNGTISALEAEQTASHYSAVWGARPGMGSAWRAGNPGIRASYYFIAVTDASTTAWGAIGHSLSWWQKYHPTWVLYACTSAGTPTHTPAYVAGLPNVPLDIRNSEVVNYQIRSVVGPYAASHGYNALGADEVTYWFAGSGGHGYYPCGIWSGSTFIRRYSSLHDLSYATDMINWVKGAHAILRASFPTLKLIVNHPANVINSMEESLLANVDGDVDETGFTDYGSYHNNRFVMEATWMRYAQQHGVAVFINQGWGKVAIGAAQRDYSVATYLMGNEQSAGAFISPHTGYGIEVWRPEYATEIGAPCAEFYGGPSLYFRRFANAIVVVNANEYSAVSASLPSGHSYVDLEGRPVHNPLYLPANDGYVLKTTNGCT